MGRARPSRRGEQQGAERGPDDRSTVCIFSPALGDMSDTIKYKSIQEDMIPYYNEGITSHEIKCQVFLI